MDTKWPSHILDDPLRPGASRNPDMLLDRKQVEETFGLSKRWLELAALRGDGPPMIKISRRMVRYRVRDIEAWLDTHRVTGNPDKG